MVGHGGSSAGSYLADPTSPIPAHCASIVATSTLRVNCECMEVILYFFIHFRVLWFLITLVMACILVVRLVDSVIKLRSFPSTTTVIKVYQNNASYPLITICNNYRIRLMRNIHQLYKLIRVPTFTMYILRDSQYLCT